MEIERKYLLDKDNIPETGFITDERIEQIYLSYDPEVRIRRIETQSFSDICIKYYLTVKTAGSLSRGEYEIEISDIVYEELMKNGVSKKLIKTRKKFDIGDGLTAEVDIYKDFNFNTVEVEFESLEQANLFVKPGWFGDEITEDKSYKNAALAKKL